MTGATDREPSFWIIKHGGCSPSNRRFRDLSNTLGVITGFAYIRTDWPILSEKTPILLECSYLKYFTERSLEPELLNQEFNKQNNWNFASNWMPLDQTIDIADCCFLLSDKIKFNG